MANYYSNYTFPFTKSTMATNWSSKGWVGVARGLNNVTETLIGQHTIGSTNYLKYKLQTGVANIRTGAIGILKTGDCFKFTSAPSSTTIGAEAPSSQVMINKPSGASMTSTTGAAVLFEFKGWILNEYNNTEYFYPVWEEIDQTAGSITWVVSGYTSTYSVFQQIQFNVTGTGTVKTKTFNSLEIGAEVTGETFETSTAIDKTYATSGTKTVGYLTSNYNANYANYRKDITVYVTDDTIKRYTIEKISSNYKIYSGQEVGSDFLNSFQVKCRRYNNYGEEITYPELSLDLAKMSKTILYESDNDFSFDYDISSYSTSATKSIYYSVGSNIHKLATGDNKFAAVQCKTEYNIGEVIPNGGMADITALGSLTYDDGTTISLSEVIDNGSSITSPDIATLPQIVTVDTPSEFTLVYNFDIQYFGVFTKEFGCRTADSVQVGRVELIGAKNNFKPSEIIDFGESAQLLVYSKAGSLLRTINRGSFNQYVSNLDERYGQQASGYLGDGTFTLSFSCYGFELFQKITFTYYEQTLSINTNNVLKSYIANPENWAGIDVSNLVVKAKKHTNQVDTETIVEEVTISSGNYDLTQPDVDFSQAKTYSVMITWSAEDLQQELNGSYDVYIEPLRAVKIVASDPQLDDNNDINNNGILDSREYFNNNEAKFKYPSGLNLEVQYNDPSYNHAIGDITLLTYYRNEEKTQTLVVNSSIVKESDGNNIYFEDPITGLSGYYSIYWLEDRVVSIEFEQKVTAYLGNKLSKLKQQIVDNGGVCCTHESGRKSYLLNIVEFNFVETSVILSEPENLEISVLNEGTFVIAVTEENMEWKIPNYKITLNTNNFQPEYNNKADIINPSGIIASVNYYEDEEYTQQCDYMQTCTYSAEATSDYNKFNVEGTGNLANYNFGGQVIDVEMGSNTELTEVINVKTTNRFTNETNVKGLEIKVLEILDITGIKLLTAKTDYYVGEEFLNETDDTKIMIFYKDANDVDRTYICNLRSGLTALNIYPLKGTKFSIIQNDRVVNITSATNFNVGVQYSINVKPKYEYSNSKTHNLVAIFLGDEYFGNLEEGYFCPDGVYRKKYFLVERTVTIDGNVKEATKQDEETGERVLADGVDVTDLVVLGYLEDIGDEALNARVILFKDYVSPIEGSNNVTVKYPCYVEGNADLINKCKFGIMFGNNNAKNRLFVSGNSEHKNKDWHSSQINYEYVEDETMLDGNYGYFEDLSECMYGETDNAVVGYDIVSNDKLLVLKTASDKETTVYFRQPQLVTAINNSGTAVTGLDDETLYQEEFSLTKGNNSVAGINPNAIANFNGDTLFISNEKQVVGLDLTGIIGDNQRYANTRSYYIDEDLKNQDLTKAFLWSNNKYLMVVLPNKIYIANFELKSNSQYEWFVTDISNVSCVLERNSNIYFGTYDGEFYKMNKIYKDAYKTFAGYGVVRMSVNEQTEILIARGELSKLDEEKTYYFKPVPLLDMSADNDPYIYYSLGTIQNGSSADCDFYVDNNTVTNKDNVLELVCRKNKNTDFTRLQLLLKRISDKKQVFFNKYSTNMSAISCKAGSPFEEAIGKPYFLKEYEGDSAKHLYQVIDENGNVMPVSDIYNARICLRVDEELEMTEINKGEGTFKLMIDGEVIDIVQYDAQALVTAFKGEIINYENVEAFYITKPYDMGSLEYSKTVWSFTLTNDTNIPSEIDLCYTTNKIPYENMKTLAKISKDVLGFDIETFNFAKVDFDKNIVPRTYTHKRVLSNVKFLCFGIRNYEDTNGVLSSMTITYTTPYPSYSGD